MHDCSWGEVRCAISSWQHCISPLPSEQCESKTRHFRINRWSPKEGWRHRNTKCEPDHACANSKCKPDGEHHNWKSVGSCSGSCQEQIALRMVLLHPTGASQPTVPLDNHREGGLRAGERVRVSNSGSPRALTFRCTSEPMKSR